MREPLATAWSWNEMGFQVKPNESPVSKNAYGEPLFTSSQVRESAHQLELKFNR